MGEHVIGDEGEIANGERITAQIEGREITVFRFEDEYHAYTNWCPHQGGPACDGILTKTKRASFDRDTLETTEEWVQDGQLLSCPWHAWKFDILTGESLATDKRLIKHEVSVRDGKIVVSL